MSFGKFTQKEILDLVSASWSPYWGTGGGGGQNPGGPTGSIQFNSASIFSGSSNFTYNFSDQLFLTGTFYVSGAISASAGFYGTSSWAQSSSYALTASYIAASSVGATEPDKSIQFSKSGFLSGSSNFTYNYDSSSVHLTGSLNIKDTGVAFTVSSSNIGTIARFSTGDAYGQGHIRFDAGGALQYGVIYPSNGAQFQIGAYGGNGLNLFGSGTPVLLTTNGSTFPIYLIPDTVSNNGKVILSGSLDIQQNVFLRGITENSTYQYILSIDSGSRQVYYMSASALTVGSASYAITASYALNAGTVDSIWVRSSGSNSAVLNDSLGAISIASATSSIAYGFQTNADGDFSQAQGSNTITKGKSSHVEGIDNITGNEIARKRYELNDRQLITVPSGALYPWVSYLGQNDQPIHYALAVDDPNSTLNNLVFISVSPSGSASGSGGATTNLYQSESLAIYDGTTRQLVKHVDLTQWWDPLQTKAHISGSSNRIAVTYMWYNNLQDRVYVMFGNGDGNGVGYGHEYAILWLSGSYDGINPPDIYLHNTSSYSSYFNVFHNWTGSVASPTAWTGSAPSLQYNANSGIEREYAPWKVSGMGASYGAWPVYNKYNGKLYYTGNPGLQAQSGITIINSDIHMEYTGTVGSSAGAGVGVTIDYELTGYGSTSRPGFRMPISGCLFFTGIYEGSNISYQPAIDSQGNIWFGIASKTAGNPIDLICLYATGSVSSSNEQLFKHTINYLNEGTGSKHAGGPFYYPGDGTPGSERIIVVAAFTGSNSRYSSIINSALNGNTYTGVNYHERWLAYDLDGNLRENPWNQFKWGGTNDIINGPAINVPNEPTYPRSGWPYRGLSKFNNFYWWENEKVFVTRFLHVNDLDNNSTEGGYKFTAINGQGSIVDGRNLNRVTSNIPIDFTNFYTTLKTSTIQSTNNGNSLMYAFHSEFFGAAPGSYPQEYSQSLAWLDVVYTPYTASNPNGSSELGALAHAEGQSTVARGLGSHTEGHYTVASGSYAHAEGYKSTATGESSHAEGRWTIASGIFSHAEGSKTLSSGQSAHAEGFNTYASGLYAHAEGQGTVAGGTGTHAEGYNSTGYGNYAHAEGGGTTANGLYSHAEGESTSAGNQGAHTEGKSTVANALYSHTEGENSAATGTARAAHAEGFTTSVYGSYAHAEGERTFAFGQSSHAEGSSSVTYGVASHAGGLHTLARGNYQTTVGKYNIDNVSTTDLFTIGDGTSNLDRHDLLNAGVGYVNIIGSNYVSGSWKLVGSGQVTGSLTVSSSLRVIGTLTVSGSFIDTGSFNLVGTGNITGSLIVSNSLNVIGSSTITGSSYITGSQYITGLQEITGSLIVSNSFQVIGNSNTVGTSTITGSLIVSNSLSVVGDSNFNGNITFTGSVLISSSLNVTGISNVTGSNNITGSWNLIGNGTITGSLIVSNSLTTIGTNTTSGSVYITGSSTLEGNSIITGSILMTGSAAISSVTYIDFVTGSNPAHSPGRVHWDLDYGTLNIDLNSTAGDEVMLKTGLDNMYYIKNQTGGTLTKGKVIRASGTLGTSGRITGAYMIADGTYQHYYTIGIAAETIDNGEDGYVYEFGLLRGIQTDGANYGESWVNGDILYVSTGSLGGLTKVEPTAPQLKIQMAIVVDAAASNGSIFIRPDIRSNIGDLHNIKDVSSTDGDLLVKSGSVWINSKQLTGSYGLTGSLSITGSITGIGRAIFNDLSATGSLSGSFKGIVSGTIDNGVSFFGTASWAQSSSVAISSSYALSSSYAFSSSYSFSSSYAESASYSVSSSYSLSSSYSVSSSYAFSSSYAVSSSWTPPGGPYTSIQFNDSNTLSGSSNYTFNKTTNEVLLTGSLHVTGSTIITGTIQINSNYTNQLQPAMQVNTQGVLVIGSQSVVPNPVPGGIYFDGNDFWLGYS